MREILEAAFLGLVQGLTEFLPVSSSGHLALFEHILGWEDLSENLTFNIAVHVGSLLAVILYVSREIMAMLTKTPRLLVVVGVATLPLVLAGPWLKPLVTEWSGNLTLIGFCFFGTALLLLAVRAAPGGESPPARVPLLRAFLIGCAQLLAVLPGVSRSGTTLTATLFSGIDRDQAVRFTFLLALPAIGGAGLLEGIDALRAEGETAMSFGALAAGTLVSFAASLWAMRLLVDVVRANRLHWFALYCCAAGVVSFVLA